MISHEQITHFSYSFPLITLGNFNKYPNKHSAHVKSVDVLDRFINSNGEIVTDRLLQLQQPLPKIFIKLGLPETSYFLERSVLNPQTQVYEAKSYSLSMRTLFQATETCLYEGFQNYTKFTQKATFDVFSYFNSMIEKEAVKRFVSNAEIGRKGLESVVENIKDTFCEFELKLEEKVFDIERQVMEQVKGSSILEYEVLNGNFNQLNSRDWDSFVRKVYDNPIFSPF